MADLVHADVLLQILLNNYFLNSRCILMITDHDNTVDYQTEVPTIFSKTHDGKIDANVIFQRFGCQEIVVRHEKPQDVFIQLEHLIKVHHERYNTRRYVFLQGKNSTTEDLTDVLVTMEASYVSDILVVVQDEIMNGGLEADRTLKKKSVDETYSLMTHAFHRDNELRVLDRWFSQNFSFLNDNDLFPDKLRDQEGKSFRMATAKYEPFVAINEEKKIYAGIELSYAMEFAKRHNMTPVLIRFTDDDPWGDIYDNWTGPGMLGIVAEGKADIAFAAIYTVEKYFLYGDYTATTGRSGVTNLVPAPKLAAGYFTPLHSFSPDTWIALAASFFFSITVLFLILQYGVDDRGSDSAEEQRISGNVELALRMMTVLYVEQSLFKLPSRRFLRFFVGLVLVQALLVSTSYSGGLASVMTVPRYEHSIKSADDLAKSGRLWGSTSNDWIGLIRHSDDETYKTIVKNYRVKTEEELAALAKEYKFIFILEKATFGRPSVPWFVGRDIISGYRLMDDIFWAHCTLMIRKSSILLPSLNNLILRVIEAGLPYQWEQYAADNFMDSMVQRVILYYSNNAEDDVVVKLQWTHVEGAFAMLILGHMLASLSFVVEIAIKYKKRHR